MICYNIRKETLSCTLRGPGELTHARTLCIVFLTFFVSKRAHKKVIWERHNITEESLEGRKFDTLDWLFDYYWPYVE